jgi:hypothetical protein
MEDAAQHLSVGGTEIGCDMGWINLSQYRDQWQALVSTLMNLRIYRRQ